MYRDILLCETDRKSERGLLLLLLLLLLLWIYNFIIIDNSEFRVLWFLIHKSKYVIFDLISLIFFPEILVPKTIIVIENDFNTLTWLFMFHLVLMLSGKTWIHVFSHSQLLTKSRVFSTQH